MGAYLGPKSAGELGAMIGDDIIQYAMSAYHMLEKHPG